MSSSKKQLGNLKVEVLDVLNTHMAQMLTGKTLSIEDKTREVLVKIVKKHFRKNTMKDGSDFVMVDGKGKTVASFPTLLKGKPPLSDFMKEDFQVPAQQPFASCDLVVKCVKAHKQQLAHMRTISSDYTFGGISKICPIPLIQGMVPVQGMCIYNLIVSLSYFIPTELDDEFAKLLNEILEFMGAWPTFEQVSKLAQFIIYRIPVLAHVPIPAIAVDHENKLMHICDQRGVPSGWHVLKIGMLAELANAGTMSTSKLNGYYVGSAAGENSDLDFYAQQLKKVKKNFPRWLTKGSLFDDLKDDVCLTAFLALSPAHLARLQNFLEVSAEEAHKIVELDSVNKNKILAAVTIQTALKGIRIKLRETEIQKVWMHLHNTLGALLDNDDGTEAVKLKEACERMYNVMCSNKKFVYQCEKQIYSHDNETFRAMLGCSSTWHSRLFQKLHITSGGRQLVVSSVRLACFNDGILHKTMPYVNACYIFFTINLFAFLSTVYSVARVCFLFLFAWYGCISLTSAILHLVKMLVISRLSKNYNKVLICGLIFFLFEVGRYIAWKKSARKSKNTQELQGGVKTSEKQMMSVMAMITLLVHAFDVDLALTMSSALNHVARMANMLTDTTSGWIMHGNDTQILQMHLFDLALEADEALKNEVEEASTSHTNQETFSTWMAEQTLFEADRTRPLSYGRPESFVVVDRENATETGQSLVDTTNAWTQVVGQTGSGKSTRLPIAYYNRLRHVAARKRAILICEPTQATTQNVAYAISHQHGKQVFYQHEGKVQNGDMSIQVMTYGTAFFKAMANDSFTQQFDAVFLDESHLITAHSLALESYLNKCTTVRKFYLSATPRNYIPHEAAQRRFQIFEHHQPDVSVEAFISSIGKGDSLDALNYGEKVLVFLSGRDQCNRAAVKTAATQFGIKAFALHRDNFSVTYPKILDALTQPGRCYVYATNILETGVTLNVDVVVDFGFTNQPKLNLVERTLLLEKRRVTEAERKQRIGRAGRLRDGHAIVLGKTSQVVEMVPPDVVFDAALLSFVYNLEIYVNGHLDSEWLSSITREQARTMLSFRLSVFFMRDLVNKQGSIRPELLQAVKNKTWKSLKVHTTSFQAPNKLYQQWNRLDHYALTNFSAEHSQAFSEIAFIRVPFITHDMLDFDLIEIAKAVSHYKPNMLTTFGSKPAKGISLVMKVDETNVFDILRAARLLKHDYENQIANKRTAINTQRESPIAYLLSTRIVDDLTAKLGQQIQKAERNIKKLDTFIMNLEAFANAPTNSEMPTMTQCDYEEIGRCMQLQQDGKLTRDNLAESLRLEDIPNASLKDAILLGNKRALLAISFLACGAFAGLAWFLTWDDAEGLNNKWNKKQRVEVHKEVLEMKGKRLNRDKRNAAMQDTFDEAYTAIRDDEDFSRVKSRRKGAKQRELAPVMRYVQQKRPFLTLYDLTLDDDITHAVFADHNNQAFYETANPLENLKNVGEHLQSHRDKGEIIFWSDYTDDTIFMTITKRDGSVQKVKLTPHVSDRKTKHGGVQGFEEHEGEYRQTGDVEILKHPEQRLEIDTRLSNNNLCLEIFNMIGHVQVEEGRLHCILYKDFIIMPAHVMQKSLPITLTFKHYTVKITELPEAYAFEGFDLLCIKRPPQLAPVKCAASLSVAQDSMIVQMVHKKFVTNKPIITITAPIHETAELRWAHQIPTVVGMCGAPVVDVQTGKIVGIHVMGDTLKKHNVFETFPQDALEILNTNDKKVHQRYMSQKLKAWVFLPETHGYDPRKVQCLQMNDTTILKVPTDTSMYTIENFKVEAQAGGLFKCRDISEPQPLPFGVVAQNMTNIAYANAILNKRHTYVGESPYWKEFKKLHAKHVQGITTFEDEYAPSSLTFDAYWKDLLKFNRQGRVDLKKNPAVLHAAMTATIRALKAAGMQETRIRSVEQVLGDIQWSTAAGPLYAMKKKELCKNLTEEELHVLAIHVKSRLIDGKNCGVWNGSMKAELRPIEKVQANKTRVFTAAPLTTLIASKFFVDDFNKQFYLSHLKAPHTVGINKFSRGWEKLYEYLYRPGWKHGSGDGSRFDSSIDPFWFDILYTIRAEFFHDDDKIVATRALGHMYREFLYTPIHTVNGNILVKQVGNNSGQPSTVVDNTLILMMSFYYAYIMKTQDFSCQHIHKNFVFVCNGDDNKFSISPEFLDTHGGDFSTEIEQLGLHYEFDELTDDITENPYMSLTMVRTTGGIGFSLHPARIIAIVQWIKKGDIVQATQAAFAAMVEAYNDPWLFSILHLYLVWLLIEFKDVLRFARQADVFGLVYMDPCQVHALHYGFTVESETSIDDSDECESDDDEEFNSYGCQQLQMNLDGSTQTPQLSSTVGAVGAGTALATTSSATETRTAPLAPLSGKPPTIQNSPPEQEPDNPLAYGDNGNTDEDVQWRIPPTPKKLGHFHNPRVKGKRVWNSRVVKNIAKEQFTQSSQLATTQQLERWVEDVKKNLGSPTETDFQIYLTSWCLWCANNGTSSEVALNQDMEIHSGGQFATIPISLFVEPALQNGGLRKVMRHFSGVTSQILEKGGVMTTWGLKRGFTQSAMIPYAFDFVVQTIGMPKTVREQLNQSKAAAIGSGYQRVMLLDGKVQRSKTSYERHIDTDIDEFEHGSAPDPRATLY